MTDVPVDNPAGRLHLILQGIREADEAQPMYQVLRDQLGTFGVLDNALFRELAAFIDLAGQVHDAVKRLPDENHDLLLRWQGDLNQLLPLLSRGVEPVVLLQDVITDATLYSLEICANLLHRREPEVVLSENKVPELITLVREAIDAMSSADELPAALRVHLVNRLQEVEYALVHIRTTGFPGVEATMDKLLGTIVREPDAARTERPVSWWHRLWAGVGSAAEGTKAISGSVGAATKAIEAVQHLSP